MSDTEAQKTFPGEPQLNAMTVIARQKSSQYNIAVSTAAPSKIQISRPERKT